MQVKDERCRRLTCQSQLLRLQQIVQTALPLIRCELKDARRFCLDSTVSLANQTARACEQTAAKVANAVQALEQKQGAECQRIAALEQENRLLRQQLEDWTIASRRWRSEREDILAASQARLKERDDLAQRCQQGLAEHEKLVQKLKEELNSAAKDYHQRLDEWRRVAEQESPQELRAWRQELMLGHEVELEQLKMEAAREAREAQEWKEKHDALAADADARVLRVQEDLNNKHRLEMEGMRARFRIVTSATLAERSPSDSSLDKLDFRPTPPASPHLLGGRLLSVSVGLHYDLGHLH